MPIKFLNGPNIGVTPTHSISVTGSPNAATFKVIAANGSTFGTYVDTGTTSGLKAAISAILASNNGLPKWIHFGPGRFHFLDAPVGNEAWAGVEDHVSWGQSSPATNGLRITGSGIDVTILSNRTNWPTGTDTEPFSFTNAQGVTITDLTVESCGFYKSTTDAIDFDQGSRCKVERVLIRRSRGRAIVIDGGDNGRNAEHNVISNIIIQGRPPKPGLQPVSGGSLTASIQYKYAIAWTDMDLAAAQTAGDTKPSAPAVVTTDGTNRSIRVHIPRGPYSATHTKVFRYSTTDGSWRLVQTISGNAPTTWVDDGTVGTTAASFTNRSTIPMGGVEFLGTTRSKMDGIIVDGIGDGVVGANQYGLHLSRKSTVPTMSDHNIITNCFVRGTYSYCVRIIGSNYNLVENNQLESPGVSGATSSGVRIEGVTGATANKNKIINNIITDERVATDPSGGAFMQYGVNIASTNSPTDNEIAANTFMGHTAAVAIINSGTTTKIRDNINSGSALWNGAGQYIVSASDPGAVPDGVLWVQP